MKYSIFALLLVATLALSGCGSGFEWFPGTPQPLTIFTKTLPDAAIGTPYSQILIATGGKTPYAWTLDSGSLPDGLTLNFFGVISGTPTAASKTSTFTVKVTDSASPNVTATQSLTITIPGAGGVLTITTTSPLKSGKVQQQYSTIKFAATGGTSTYNNWSTSKAANCPPTGLNLNKTTGEFGGTPAAGTAGTCTFTVWVFDTTIPTPLSGSAPFTITVQ